MVNRYGSRQEAMAVAKKLARHFPANEYDVWPDGQGFWVLVVRCLDDEGHVRFKFVAHDQPAPNKSHAPPQETVAIRGSAHRSQMEGQQGHRIRLTRITSDFKSPAAVHCHEAHEAQEARRPGNPRTELL